MAGRASSDELCLSGQFYTLSESCCIGCESCISSGRERLPCYVPSQEGFPANSIEKPVTLTWIFLELSLS